MIKKRCQFQSEQTPSSTDTTSREYWLASQPSISHGHTNIYSQVLLYSGREGGREGGGRREGGGGEESD